MSDHGEHGEKARRRRSFTREFKAEIVELCQHGDRSVGQAARDFDLTETVVGGLAFAERAGSSAATRAGGDGYARWDRNAACLLSGPRAKVRAPRSASLL
jgi:hypothetical protein